MSFPPTRSSQIFLSTPSARRATLPRAVIERQLRISIHALREEGDGEVLLHSEAVVDFYPRPPRGGRRERRLRAGYQTEFLSTPSARRATGLDRQQMTAAINFYPRPPRGGRLNKYDFCSYAKRFLSTPSARRATRARQSVLKDIKFLSTPSARRATAHRKRTSASPSHFYPRPPRGGRRVFCTDIKPNNFISIHALREEGDGTAYRSGCRTSINFYPRPPRGGRHSQLKMLVGHSKFLSTPSARRATYSFRWECTSPHISIHALREEGDGPVGRRCARQRDFYPRPPRGGRR